MGWRVIGLKLGAPLAIWTLIFAIGVGILALNGVVTIGMVRGILPLTVLLSGVLTGMVSPDIASRLGAIPSGLSPDDAGPDRSNAGDGGRAALR